MTSPLISFVIPARNDQYAGNTNYRLKVTLDFLAMNLRRLNRLNDVEIMVVDWGSDTPLSEALSLSEDARRITRFILITKEVTQKISPNHGFPTPIVLNAGIRRASGMFIAQTLSDVLFPEKIVKKIFAICDDTLELKKPARETLFVFSRKQVPQELVDTQPSVSELEAFIDAHGQDLYVDSHPFHFVPADCQLMHRSLWQASRGYDERHVYWGWSDTDLVIRIRLKYTTLNELDNELLYVYHLNHYAPPSHTRKHNAAFFNPFTVNDEMWGLANYRFHEAPSADFSPLLPSLFSGETEVPKSEEYYRRKYILMALKFAFTNVNRRGISGAKSFLKQMMASNPRNSLCYKIYFYGRKLRKANRMRSAMPSKDETNVRPLG